MLSSEVLTRLSGGELDEKLSVLYACGREEIPQYRERFTRAVEQFEALYGKNREIHLFSAPGRTEVGGNHTDHQRGCVLAASVNLDAIAVVAKNGGDTVRVKSEGYPEDVVTGFAPVAAETGSSQAIVRGMCAEFEQRGYEICGFDAYTTSNVLSGSGLSSSAAFEVLLGNILNGLFCENKETPLFIAQAGQRAENAFFGKPCGLMDQAASSIGGFVSIDFEDASHPKVERVDFNPARYGFSLCIVDTKGSHADLTPDYAAVPAEMKAVAGYFGKEVLREVDEENFFRSLPMVRAHVGDRAALRAIHFFAENRRAQEEAKALKAGDFDSFKQLVIESGRSSFLYLQNVYSPAHPDRQGVSLALALCERLLAPRSGAWRVHGGGFAGTIQAFVPNDFLETFRTEMEALLGKDTCHVLRIRPVGGVQIL